MNDQTSPFGRFVAELDALESSKRFSSADLETIYTLAYNLYSGGRYDEALRYFAFLTLYRPTDRKFLLGLAATQQAGRAYEAAIQTYAFITLLDPTDPGPTLRIGECLMQMGQLEEARDSFNMVVAVAGSGSTHAAAKARAQGLLDVISKAGVPSAATA
jgi:type III secretion system low calcium response chaperone LcrH/SycD